MAEIEKLAKIPTLKKLSLHGNPIENEKVRTAETIYRGWLTIKFGQTNLRVENLH